jgi:hypothetical protein
MRLLLFLASFLLAAAGLHAGAAARPAAEDEIALFKEAIRNSAQDTEHWAYTETSLLRASKGGNQGETIVRFDPSKPYGEQFTPLQVNGQPPTEKQLKEYRRRGEKRGEQVARAAEAAKDPAYVPPPPQLKIAGGAVTLDVGHPQVAQADADRVTFELPLQSKRSDIPIDKFQVLAVVGRTSRVVESVSLHLRESFRLKLIAKVKAGEARLDFTMVDPKFGPVLTTLTGDFNVSLLFVPVNGTFIRTRTDWKRVKSFDERLQVKLGPLQFLDS